LRGHWIHRAGRYSETWGGSNADVSRADMKTSQPTIWHALSSHQSEFGCALMGPCPGWTSILPHDPGNGGNSAQDASLRRPYLTRGGTLHFQPKEITMKYLAIVSFVIGVLAAPIAAQAQQSLPGSPQGFNGLVWDPPAQTYVAPDATK
jgi:hypothetical protein